jgi:hypothetical protein
MLLAVAAATTASLFAAPLSAAVQAEPGPSGDIPDNQVFLQFTSTAGRWSIRYPEGWARTASGTGNSASVSFRDRGNSVRVAIAPGAAPTSASVTRSVRAIRGSHLVGRARSVKLSGGAAVELTFTTVGAADPVTGKRLTITTDRYQLGHTGRVATIDLSTPVGVDNVDAFRLISDSFRWR